MKIQESLKKNKIGAYIQSSYEELQKVSWPTRKETIQHTYVVVGMCIAVAIFIGGIDYLLNLLFEILI